MLLLSGEEARQASEALLADCEGPPAVTCVDLGGQGGLDVLALASPERAVLIDASSVAGLQDLWRRPRPFAAYDAKAVHRTLLRHGGAAPERWGCVRLSAQLLAGGRPLDLDLAAQAAAHGLAPLPPPTAGLAALAAHACGIAALVRQQAQALQRADLRQVSRLEAAAVAPIAEMEQAGMPFRTDSWRQLAATCAEQRAALGRRLAHLLDLPAHHDLFGEAVNQLDDAERLRQALERAGHPVANLRRRTLAALPAPLGPALAEFRQLSLLVSSYGTTFLQHVGSDGRVHSTFEQIGASTGRMACHAPNLQAMVKGTPHRACFAPAAERRLVVADYAACELRILAQVSQDPVFLAAFRDGVDLHAQVAARLYGRPVSRSEAPELRQIAKVVSFGLAYGMGAGGLAQTLGLRRDRAQALLEQYFRTFPRIRAYLEEAADQALQRGFAATLSGRRLYFAPDSQGAEREQMRRIAKNMPIQGTNADMIKLALADLRRRLQPLARAQIVHCIHDELLVECQADDAEAVQAALTAAMVAAGRSLLPDVPIGVDCRIATAWG